MAPIGTVQICGKANAGPAEVELNTHAIRRVIRPNDYTNYGSYGAAAYAACATPTLPATQSFASGVPTFFFYWANAGRIAVIRKASYGMVRYGTVANALNWSLSIQRVTNIVYPPVGFLAASGTNTLANTNTITPSPLRDTMTDSAAIIMSNPSASAKTGFIGGAGGQPTLGAPNLSSVADGHTIAGYSVGLSTTAGTGTGMVPLLDQAAGTHPVVLTEGMGLQFALLSTGSAGTAENIDSFMSIQWDEYRAQDL